MTVRRSSTPLFSAERPAVAEPRRRDGATGFGMVLAAALVASTIAANGHAAAFLDAPSLLIVFGGTVAAVLVACSFADVARMLRAVRSALFAAPPSPSEAAARVMPLAEAARIQGPLYLEQKLASVADAPLLHKALALIADGIAENDFNEMMHHDLAAARDRHRRAAAVLRRAADFAPAMGLIGTLIGLVQMLGTLDNPGAIGPSMALALLTTLYGAILANLVFAPLASKLERNAADDDLVNRIFVLAAGSMLRQENPRRLELVLNSALPVEHRIHYFE